MKWVFKFVFISCFLYPVTIFSQKSFEGFIVYNNHVVSKSKDLKSEDILRLTGTVQKSFYNRDGAYVNVIKNGMVRVQYYNTKSNLIYNLFESNDTLFFKDASINKDPATSYEVNQDGVTILGRNCKEITILAEKTVMKFLFNESLFIDPNLFVNHKYGNWHYALSKCKSLPLRIIIETPSFILTSTAVALKEERIKNDVFIIPEGAQKVPYRW